jgi:hypothetical protein
MVVVFTMICLQQSEEDPGVDREKRCAKLRAGEEDILKIVRGYILVSPQGRFLHIAK